MEIHQRNCYRFCCEIRERIRIDTPNNLSSCHPHWKSIPIIMGGGNGEQYSLLPYLSIVQKFTSNCGVCVCVFVHVVLIQIFYRNITVSDWLNIFSTKAFVYGIKFNRKVKVWHYKIFDSHPSLYHLR